MMGDFLLIIKNLGKGSKTNGYIVRVNNSSLKPGGFAKIQKQYVAMLKEWEAGARWWCLDRLPCGCDFGMDYMWKKF